ncbi:MAG: SPOR domain-containing protein [Hansschlegelia sp.]
MNHSDYDDHSVTDIRLAPPSPVLIWGALMMVALFSAGATAWISRNSSGERIVASDGEGLRREVAVLAEQRTQLLDRLNRLERGVGELKIAARATDIDVTGSLGRGVKHSPTGTFALSLGPDVTVDAVRRRWAALVARYPQSLAQLSGRAAKAQDGQGVYDLVAGPFATRSDAERACATLADQGFPCDTTVFAGEPLTTP